MSEDVKKIRIEDYNYDLPDEKIAKYPLAQRDHSKLLIADGGIFKEDIFKNLSNYLPRKSLLIFNETKVVQARLLFPHKESTIEIFCLEPVGGMDIQSAMAQKNKIKYKCMVGGARKWKNGKLSVSQDKSFVLYAEKLSRNDDSFTIQFSWDEDLMFSEVLEKAGKTPLPPYLKRKAEQSDKERYQTIFARMEGSVAAPTASLHFTDAVLKDLEDNGIESAKITLHVGAGTFKPVNSELVGDHSMHAEEFILEKTFIQKIIDHSNQPIIPVGTTSMRALESIYWLGVKALNDELHAERINHIEQWIPYEKKTHPAMEKAMKALMKFMEDNAMVTLRAKTSIIIAPAYQNKLCAGLISNFHQPKSTLLLLIASMMGNKWKSMYKFAALHNFRFLSYGDSCLILNRK